MKIAVSHSFQAAIFGRRPMFSGFQASKTASVVRMFGIFDGGVFAGVVDFGLQKITGGRGLFAPAENPRLLVWVMVDTPLGDIYGGTVAAPACERIMEFALPYLKIPPD